MRIYSWIHSLFNKQSKRKYTQLTRTEVFDIESKIRIGLSNKDLCKKYDISIGTYYKIKNGTHKHQRLSA